MQCIRKLCCISSSNNQRNSLEKTSISNSKIQRNSVEKTNRLDLCSFNELKTSLILGARRASSKDFIEIFIFGKSSRESLHDDKSKPRKQVVRTRISSHESLHDDKYPPREYAAIKMEGKFESTKHIPSYWTNQNERQADAPIYKDIPNLWPNPITEDPPIIIIIYFNIEKLDDNNHFLNSLASLEGSSVKGLIFPESLPDNDKAKIIEKTDCLNVVRFTSKDL